VRKYGSDFFWDLVLGSRVEMRFWGSRTGIVVLGMWFWGSGMGMWFWGISNGNVILGSLMGMWYWDLGWGCSFGISDGDVGFGGISYGDVVLGISNGDD
jgi:hypothetical protein